MSEQPDVPTDLPPLDLSALAPQPVDLPDTDPGDAPAPDHTASEDAKVSPLDKVRRARETRENAKGATRAPKKKTAPRRTREGELVAPLTDIYSTLGIALSPFDPACGAAVLANAEQCAKSLDTLARQNDSVRRVLLGLTQTSAWGGVIAAHLPLLLMVTVHHGPDNVASLAAPLAMQNEHTRDAMAMLIAQNAAKTEGDTA